MIYIVSDLHSNISRTEKLIEKAFRHYGSSPGEGDVLVVLGDLFDPLNTRLPKGTKFRENLRFLGWLSQQPFDIATIRGNRETPRLLAKMKGKADFAYGGRVLRLASNVVVFEDGQKYQLPLNDTETIDVLAVGGALSHVVRFKKLGIVDEQPYRHKYLFLKHTPDRNAADIVLSHDVPLSKMGILRLLFGANVYNEELDDVMHNTEFHRWLFGHHHVDIRPAKGFRGIYKDILCLGRREDVFGI